MMSSQSAHLASSGSQYGTQNTGPMPYGMPYGMPAQGSTGHVNTSPHTHMYGGYMPQAVPPMQQQGGSPMTVPTQTPQTADRQQQPQQQQQQQQHDRDGQHAAPKQAYHMPQYPYMSHMVPQSYPAGLPQSHSGQVAMPQYGMHQYPYAGLPSVPYGAVQPPQKMARYGDMTNVHGNSVMPPMMPGMSSPYGYMHAYAHQNADSSDMDAAETFSRTRRACEDRKRKVLECYERLDGSIKAVAEELQLPYRMVQGTIRRYRRKSLEETGSVPELFKKRGLGRPKQLTKADEDVIFAVYVEHFQRRLKPSALHEVCVRTVQKTFGQQTLARIVEDRLKEAGCACMRDYINKHSRNLPAVVKPSPPSLSSPLSAPGQSPSQEQPAQPKEDAKQDEATPQPEAASEAVAKTDESVAKADESAEKGEGPKSPSNAGSETSVGSSSSTLSAVAQMKYKISASKSEN